MENNQENQLVGKVEHLNPATVRALQSVENKEEYISNVINRLNVNLENHDYETASKLADILAALLS